MSDITQIEIDQSALIYIGECLAEANFTNEKALSQFLQQIPLEQGKFTAFLTNDSSSEARLAFHTGGILSAEDSRTPFYEFTAKFLKKSNDSYLIVESFSASPNNEWIKGKPEEPIFFCGDTVLYFTDSQHHDLSTVEDVIMSATGPYLTVGILTCAEGIELPLQQQVPLETVKALANGTEHLLVTAYDSETFLIWSK
jgi:hypothetical protein